MKLESEFNADQSALFQSRGALFAVDERSECFLFASENVDAFAGTVAHDLLGRSIREVLGRQVTHALRNAGSMPSLDRRRQHMGQFDLSGTPCEISVFRAGSILVLEATPKVGEHDPSAYDVLKDIEVLTDVLLTPSDLESMLTRYVALMRTMSGFHCVCLSRWQEAGYELAAVSGRAVLAEASCEAPEQFHTVHDVNSSGVGLTGLEDHDVPPLDLAALRIPGDTQLSSCRNAGVAACASVGVRWGGKLLGALKFLHETPRTPNKRTQFAVAHLAPLIGQRLSELS